MSNNFFTQTAAFISNFAADIGKSLSGLFSRIRNKKITVEAEVKRAKKAEEIKHAVESLPKAKTLEVNIEKRGDFSGLSLTGKNLDKTITLNSNVTGRDKVQELGAAIDKLPEKKTISAPPVSQWANLKDEFADLRSSVNDLGGGLKNLTDKLMTSGGGLLILYEGFKSLIKIGQHFYDSWINGMKETAAMSEKNTGGIREAALANEEMRQKGDEYLKQREQLASQESLSIANKEQAAKAIGEQTNAYADLGIKLDETTGKLTGMDSAMIKKAEKDKSRKIKELEAELRGLENSNQQQAEFRDKAGIPVWFGGEEESESAARKIEESNKRIIVIRRNLHDLRQSDPAGEIRARKKAEAADLEVKNRERQKTFEQRKKDDEFAETKTAEEKITNRQEVIKKFTGETLEPLNRQVAAAQEKLAKSSGDDRTEAERNLLQLQEQRQIAEEKIYGGHKQIRNVQQRFGITALPEKPVQPKTPVDTPVPKSSGPDGKSVSTSPKTDGRSVDPAAGSKKSAPAQAVLPPVQPDHGTEIPDKANEQKITVHADSPETEKQGNISVTGETDVSVSITAEDQSHIGTGENAAIIYQETPSRNYFVKGTGNTLNTPKASDRQYQVSGTEEAPEIQVAKDQTYQVAGTVTPPEIPQAQDQEYTITANTAPAERALYTLSTKSITVTADTMPAEQAIANLPQAEDQSYTITGQLNAPDIPQAQNQEYTVTANTAPAERALSTLSTPSTKSITVTADTMPAEQAIANLPQAQDQQYQVTGQLNAPEIPQAEDQAYTITGQLNAPEIPQAQDQEYTITGSVSAPEIPVVSGRQYQVTGRQDAPGMQETPIGTPAPNSSGPGGKSVSTPPKTDGLSVTPAADSKKSPSFQAVLPPVHSDKAVEMKILPDRSKTDRPQIISSEQQRYSEKSSDRKETDRLRIIFSEQQRLQASNRDKAQDLKWQFMEKTGRGKEASEQRALRDAERTKGSKLTDSEIAATKKLHDLTWNMQNMRDPQFGDLDIKTNSLTARGGFQGAAYVPDTEKYNRQIAQANQSMLSVLQRIESMCRDLNKF